MGGYSCKQSKRNYTPLLRFTVTGEDGLKIKVSNDLAAILKRQRLGYESLLDFDDIIKSNEELTDALSSVELEWGEDHQGKGIRLREKALREYAHNREQSAISTPDENQTDTLLNLFRFVIPKDLADSMLGDLEEIVIEKRLSGAHESEVRNWLRQQLAISAWPLLKWYACRVSDIFLKTIGLTQAVEWLFSKF